MFDLKKFRKERKLTQTEFGKKLGYTHSYISNIENNKERVTDRVLDKIAEVFNVDLTKYKSYYKQEGQINTESDEVRIWKEKYYALLEKHNLCLEERDKLKEGYKRKPATTPKPAK